MKSLPLVAGFLLLLAGLPGCTGAPAQTQAQTQDDADRPCDPESHLRARAPLELFVEPDAASAPYVATIERANQSLDVMIYEMGFGPIFDALAAKARAGVRVRIIFDVAQKSVNQRYSDELAAAGATVLWSDPGFTFMHAKTIVTDGVEAIISTGNYGASIMARERNYVVRDVDPDDVAALERLFEADFARQPVGPELDLACTRLLVAPINARDGLLAFIHGATTSIEVESMQLADRDVRDALAERKAAGVHVRVLLAAPSWIDANTNAASFLAAHEIPTRWKANPNLHVKAVVVDGTSAYAGSINLSTTSITKNREVGVLLDEPSNVATMLATFEADWEAGSEFTSSPRPGS
jgi:phosphatidylserine/phosphatidylglycerophosphate/cardiolipin synthase-like enzyme